MRCMGPGGCSGVYVAHKMRVRFREGLSAGSWRVDRVVQSRVLCLYLLLFLCQKAAHWLTFT